MSEQEQVRTAERVEAEGPKFEGGYIAMNYEGGHFWRIAQQYTWGRPPLYRHIPSDRRVFRLPADDEKSMVEDLAMKLAEALRRVAELEGEG